MTHRGKDRRDRLQSAVITLVGSEAGAGSALCGGITLLDRLLRQLKKAEVKSVILLKPRGGWDGGIGQAAGRARKRWPETVKLLEVDPGARDSGLLCALKDKLPRRFLYLPSNLLVDQRILDRLLGEEQPVLLDWDEALVGVLDLDMLSKHGLDGIRRLRPTDASGYQQELRRRIRHYLMLVKTPSEVRQGSRILLKHAQKGALDLPARYFDGPFENILVRLLSPTSISPNMVTVGTTIAALGIGLLFWAGWLKTGAFCALLIGILDGVDGKLARIKLETSRLGELEHVADFFYENAWYLAIASYLNMLPLGFVMMMCDLADNLAYLVVQRRHRLLLDEMSPFDTAFRQIAGRRNIYVWIFLVGFYWGSPPATLVVAAAWALVTALIHWLRALKWINAPIPRKRAEELTRQDGEFGRGSAPIMAGGANSKA